MAKSLKLRSIMLWVALAIATSVLVIISAIGIRILFYPTAIPEGTYDCAIVLGAAVTENQPSPVFQARLDHGITLYQTDVVDRLIFTGGIGAGDRAAESEVGAQYAQAQGIPPTDILIEKTSKTTTQNLRGVKTVMDSHQLSTAVIVSDPFHLNRSVMIANWLGIDAIASATPTTRYQSWKSKLPFLLREIYFTIHFTILRR